MRNMRIIRIIRKMAVLLIILAGIWSATLIINQEGFTRNSSTVYAMSQSEYDQKVNEFINDSRWRNGTSWGYYQKPKIAWNGIGCCAYVNDFVRYVYGADSQNVGTIYTGVSNIRTGDVLYINNATWGEHWIAVLGKNGNILYTAEGNVLSNNNYVVKISNAQYSINGSTIYSQGVGTYTLTRGYHYEDISSNQPFHVWIDTPTVNTSFTNKDVEVYGLSINGNGVTKVNCVINEQTFPCTQFERKDVAAAYPGYPTGKEGFKCTIPQYALLEGTNTLRVDSYCGNTLLGSKTVTFTYKNKGSQTLKDGMYYIKSALNEKYALDVDNSGTTNGSNVEINELTYATSQKFSVKYLGNGYYRILSEPSGKCVEVKDASSAKAANIQIRDYYGEKGQMFIIKSAGDGYYYMISSTGGTYLDVAGAVVANGTNVQTWVGNNNKAQKWKFVSTTPHLSSDGWYYTHELPSSINTTNSEIQYQNIYFTFFSNITSSWGTTADDDANLIYYRYRLKPTAVSLNKTTLSLTKKGQTSTLSATISPSKGTNTSVTWKSSNTSVATVSAKGVVTAVGNGTATITVTTASGSKTATCKVTVSIATTGVSLNKTSVTLTEKGKTLTLSATISPSNAADKKVTWKSSNTSVATVSAKGVVTAVGNGTATITVTTASGSKTATCKVVVNIPSILYGDANNDGKVNSKDVVMMKKHLAGYSVNIYLGNCDVNIDGKVNSKDVVMVMKYLAGYNVVLGK